MAVDMSDVLKPVKWGIEAGEIELGAAAALYVRRAAGDSLEVSFRESFETGWYMDKKTLMNLSEAARLLAEALP